jgi:uncharacterized membrane protein (UPF0127 family)
MRKKKILLFSVIILVIFAVAFFIFQNFKNKEVLSDINYVEISGTIMKVEAVYSPELQEKGLSGREELEENSGMLFVFANSGKYSFWMKEMKFAIDIIWINAEGKVVFIKKSVGPETFPESFVSDQDAKFILETKAGFSEKNNLQVGDFVKFLH